MDPFRIDPKLIPEGYAAQWVSLTDDPFVFNRGWTRLESVEERLGNILVIKPKDEVAAERKQQVDKALQNEAEALAKIKSIAAELGMEVDITKKWVQPK